MSPKFSIILPTYNSEKHIKECLESIARQSFTNFELLVIDGASTDSTLEIAETFRSQIPNLIIISEKDKGIYDAMNKGIKLAKGEILYFLGSDDKLYNGEVLEKVDRGFSSDIDVLYGDVWSSRFDGTYDGEFTEQKIIKRNICHQAIFLRKEIFTKTGLFDLKYSAHADWDYNLKWFFDDEIKHKYIDLIIANYADHGFSSDDIDKTFKQDLPFILLKRTRAKIPKKEYLYQIKKAYGISKRESKYAAALKYVLLYMYFSLFY